MKPEKSKLKHDLSNSIVIINNLAKTASSIVNKVSQDSLEKGIITQRQLEIFLQSMSAIQNETIKIQKLFEQQCDIG